MDRHIKLINSSHVTASARVFHILVSSYVSISALTFRGVTRGSRIILRTDHVNLPVTIFVRQASNAVEWLSYHCDLCLVIASSDVYCSYRETHMHPHSDTWGNIYHCDTDRDEHNMPNYSF